MPRKPPNYGKLRADERQKLDAWLADKGCRCPSCGAREWGEPDAGMLAFASGVSASHPDDHPVIKLPCGRCGLLAFFDPFTIGVY